MDRAGEETWTFRRICPRTILLPARPAAKASARWQGQVRSRADAARHGRGSELPCAGGRRKRLAQADLAPFRGRRGSWKKAPHHEFRGPHPLYRQQHIVEHGEPGKQMGDLKCARHSQCGPAMAGPMVMSRPNRRIWPRCRRKNAGYNVEQRGLAGAVRADNGLSVSRHDAERDIMHCAQAAETLGQPAQFKRGLNGTRRGGVHVSPPAGRATGRLAARRSRYSQNLQGGKSRL